METPAQDLFLQAAELEPFEYDAFLDRACGENAELRLEVERMLEDARRADLFLGAADGVTLSAEEFQDAYAEKEGDLVGPYKLRQQIGEGGFGVVWMAEQSQPISRMVALKVVKAGMDTKLVLARFEAERQALAMMDHANIARVLDAGATAAGRPYFAMELVKGIPITQFCDEGGLDTRERLALFRDVCSAINHAHQKGVIHRDIKPSNVMVTLHGDKAVVKVIDFGIAKATQGKLTEQTLFTRFEQFIGTPAYMSPEQAALSGLDIDTRSDIYSLGVLLYELLTGKPPFDGRSLASAGLEEMRRIIREVEPPKPSSRLSTVAGDERTQLAKSHRVEPEKLNKLVEPDLDWIVMKAIEKDRTRRYETANAFAQDIVRFLADEPVSARPPGAGYQFGKFARRHKAALRVGAAIAAVLVTATAVSTWQAVRATAAEEKTAATLEQVAAERDAKELARQEAEDIATFLGDVFQSPDPARDGREIKVVELLDKAAKKLETELATQPAQRAKLQITLGTTYRMLGLARQSVPLQEQALDYYRRTVGPEHPNTLVAMHNLANSYFDAGRRDDALKLGEEVLKLSRKVDGPEHPGTLRAMYNLADSYDAAGRRDEGLGMLEDAMRLSRKVNGPEHPDTLSAMNNLAAVYSEADRWDEAFKMKEEVLAVSRKVNGPEHPITLASFGNLAHSYFDTGRRDEALAMREEMLALSRKMLGPEHPDTLLAMGTLATSYHEAARRDEALAMREEVLALRRKVSGPEHPDTLMAMTKVAISYADADHRDEALKLCEEVLALSRKVNGPEHLDTLLAMSILAMSYQEAARLDDALKLNEEVLALTRKARGPQHPDTLLTMGDLAESYLTAGRIEDSLALLTELSVVKPEDTSVALKLAALQVWFGKGAEHAATSRRVLSWAKETTKPDDLERVARLSCLRSITDAAAQEEALLLARKALDLRKVGQPPSPWDHLALGMAEYRSGHHQEAVTALNAVPDSLSADTPHAASIENTANFYRTLSLFQQGKPDDARALFTATEAKMKPFPADQQKPFADKADPNHLILWLACKEAKALLYAETIPEGDAPE